ncbi:MAG: hypothetical protein ACRCXV_11175 [Bacteroidales bacterium]
MKEFRQTIPSGMEARVENGEVIYTPIEKCPFEVGDVIFLDPYILVFYGVSDSGNIILRHSLNCKDGVFNYSEDYIFGEHFSNYTKAAPQQENNFICFCLENNVWFDSENKKWIDLVEGMIYKILAKSDESSIFIFKEFTDGGIFDYAALIVGESQILIKNSPTCFFNNVLNISEATKEEKQQLFGALKEKGKQWNADKRCVEELKWKPEAGDEYWIMASNCTAIPIMNNLSDNDMERIAIGNFFKTEDECEKYIDYMKGCSMNYKP